MNKIRGLILVGILALTAQKAHAWDAKIAAPPLKRDTDADYIVNFTTITTGGPVQRQVQFNQVQGFNDLMSRCRRQIALYITIDNDTSTTDTPVLKDPDPPTQAQIDQAQWISDYSNYRRLKALFDQGIFDPVQNPAMKAQLDGYANNVKTNFKISYLIFVSP